MKENTELTTTDYSKAVKIYDNTRIIPGHILEKAIDLLITGKYIEQNMFALDLGCGTGQFTGTFANEGFQVIGVDISKEMIKYAKNKNNINKNVDFKVGDARKLDFEDNEFDFTVSSKLFLHIKDWQKSVDEIIRVTKKDRFFIYINETGYFSNKVRIKFRELADLYGYKNRFLGTYDFNEIIGYFKMKAKKHRLIDAKKLSWKRSITYGQAFTEIKNKSFAEFWYIEEKDYRSMLKETAGWIKNIKNGFDTEEKMDPRLRIDIFTI